MPLRGPVAGHRLDFRRGKGGVRRTVSDAIAAVGYDEAAWKYVVLRVNRRTGEIDTQEVALREAYRLLEETVVRYGRAVIAEELPVAELSESGKWELVADCADGWPRMFYAQDSEPRPRARSEMSQRRRFEILSRDNYTCHYCGRSAPEVVLHVDHVKPVARGGKGDDANLVTACADCNLGKGSRSA